MAPDEQGLRPTDPFTAKDGAALFAELKKIKGELLEEIRNLSNRIGSIQKDSLQIRESLVRIEAGNSDNRVSRLEIELREAELEQEAAERALDAIKEKIQIKQSIKANSVDTQEKMKSAYTSAFADLENQRKQNQAAYMLDLKKSILKAVLISFAVGATGGVLGLIWWLIQLYAGR